VTRCQLSNRTFIHGKSGKCNSYLRDRHKRPTTFGITSSHCFGTVDGYGVSGSILGGSSIDGGSKCIVRVSTIIVLVVLIPSYIPVLL
jgi:hypothetical protein